MVGFKARIKRPIRPLVGEAMGWPHTPIHSEVPVASAVPASPPDQAAILRSLSLRQESLGQFSARS
jgi:hypothetical protein